MKVKWEKGENIYILYHDDDWVGLGSTPNDFSFLLSSVLASQSKGGSKLYEQLLQTAVETCAMKIFSFATWHILLHWSMEVEGWVLTFWVWSMVVGGRGILEMGK